MSRLIKLGKIAALLTGTTVVALGGVHLWVSHSAAAHLARKIPTHQADLIHPSDAGTPAAAARGKHLVQARYGCEACHGKDLSGGVMLDDPMLGRLLGPNLTSGVGGRSKAYSDADWDAIVRHGVKPDGTVSLMPSSDNFAMTDEELSDIVSYIRSLRPIDRTTEASMLGPVGRVLLVTGQLPSSADLHADHQAPHSVAPPDPSDTLAFGAHLSRVCTGCHRTDFTGGPVQGGDPSWAPAADLTPNSATMAGRTQDDLWQALLASKRRDGTPMGAPMSEVVPLLAAMTRDERSALWTYLQSIPPAETGT